LDTIFSRLDGAHQETPAARRRGGLDNSIAINLIERVLFLIRVARLVRLQLHSQKFSLSVSDFLFDLKISFVRRQPSKPL
jgi:hypothetical protein